MPDRYEPSQFEAKWQDRWKEADLFSTQEDSEKPKYYALDFFPYPSGAGLSVGHCRNYIPTDVLARMKRMQGFSVLHPMGFDAFGLPAEVEAIRKKTHPAPMIAAYADTYRRQMDLVGISYDWSRSFSSSDPAFYRWTQWMFKLLYDRGLAYRKDATVNWCEFDRTVLADEEVVVGTCWRCGNPVVKKAIPQWFFKITAYAQQLIDDLETIDWPEGIKAQQRNWIGRSEGVEFEWKVNAPDQEKPLGGGESFRVFTTRIDTVYGATFCVLAPEHPLVEKIARSVSEEQRDAIRECVKQAKALSDTARQSEDREKTGVFTGAHAVNPFSKELAPIYIADYVLMGYGTGAIMAVPAHDERDFAFAKKFGIQIRQVIQPVDGVVPEDAAFSSKEGSLVNSGDYDGQPVFLAQQNMAEWLEKWGIGERKIQYRMRDWLVSRQRYWGSPIPVVHNSEGDIETVPDECLPVLLPDVDHYEPGEDGSSPLTKIPEFVNVTDSHGRLGRRETDTMGGFVCSSWYFLRFCDPYNDEAPFDTEKANYWMPVDCYVGGAEHAVMHLLYARFFTKVLHDAGYVNVREPFAKLHNQGQVLAMTPYRKAQEGERLDIGEEGILISFEEAKKLPKEDLIWRWARMSKSKGNVVTPDEAVEQFGADALRIYELFVAPFEADFNWSNEGMNGAVRFLNKVFKLYSEFLPHFEPEWRGHLAFGEATPESLGIRRATHKAIKKVTDDIERFAFNTSISALMIYVNSLTEASKDASDPAKIIALSEALEMLALLLSPIAPHTADELWSTLGKDGFTLEVEWPGFDPALTVDETVTIAVQVNGKLRDTLVAAADATQESLQAQALALPKVAAHVDGKTVRKVIVVPGRLVNIVVG